MVSEGLTSDHISILKDVFKKIYKWPFVPIVLQLLMIINIIKIIQYSPSCISLVLSTHLSETLWYIFWIWIFLSERNLNIFEFLTTLEARATPENNLKEKQIPKHEMTDNC